MSDSSKSSRLCELRFPLFFSGGVHAGHDPCDGHHDNDVDAQWRPVLRLADVQREVRLDEEDDIDKEASPDAQHSGDEATRDDTDDDGNYQHQRGGGDAQVRAERQHDRGKRRHAGKCCQRPD